MCIRDRVKRVICFPAVHDIQRLGMQFITDTFLIRSGRGDDKKPVSYTHLDVYKRQMQSIVYLFRKLGPQGGHGLHGQFKGQRPVGIGHIPGQGLSLIHI